MILYTMHQSRSCDKVAQERFYFTAEFENDYQVSDYSVGDIPYMNTTTHVLVPEVLLCSLVGPETQNVPSARPTTPLDFPVPFISF